MDESSREYKYDAYLSHCSLDGELSHWLELQLRNWRFPLAEHDKAKAQGIELPQKLGPFAPVEGPVTSTAEMEAARRQEVALSKYLIVICSPGTDSTKEESLRIQSLEINEFLKNNKAERVLPFVVNCASEDPEEYKKFFPPELLRRDLGFQPAVNLNVLGKLNAKLTLINRMFGINLPLETVAPPPAKESHFLATLFRIVMWLAILGGAYYYFFASK